jgi:hypothetical protein
VEGAGSGLPKTLASVGIGGAMDSRSSARPRKVASFGPKSSTATQVASGAHLLVDVEFGRQGHRRLGRNERAGHDAKDAPRGRLLYALSQGPGVPGALPGSPAEPNSSSLVKVNQDGTFSVIIDSLNLPTSLEIIKTTAYVATLNGEIWKIDGV